MRVVGIVAPFAPLGTVPGENRFNEPRVEIGTEDLFRVPLAAVRHEEPGKLQGRDRVWIVKGSCEFRVRGVSIRGKFVLSKNLGYKTRGVAMWLT